jgi:hypothetical protein
LKGAKLRYRIGENGELLTATSTDDVMIATCVLSIFIGALLAWAGWRGRQWWLVFLCGGLVPVSIATLVWEYFRTTT